jgi:fermentation-respiration switch protein FrsA (DUF1100 family)
MLRRTRRVKVALSVLAVAALGTIASLVVRRALHVPWFPYMGRPLSDAGLAALARDGWQTGKLDVGGGVVLRGLERKPSDASAPFVVFFGGNSPQFLEEAQKSVDALRAGRDWGGSVWAYRGYDGSGGKPSADVLEADASRVLTHVVHELGVTRERVHVVAFSLGTDPAIAASARAGDDRPATLTLLAPFTMLDMRPAGTVQGHRYDPQHFLDDVRGPVLIVHGLRDATLDPEGSKTLAEKLGDRARRSTHAELAHLDLPTAPVVLDEVRAFITAGR